MPITINGSGTVTGITAGGLPDGCIVTADIVDNNVTAAKIADNTITELKLANGAVTQAKIAATAAVPIGAVFYFASSTIPAGYLKCNGDTVTNGVGTIQSVTADFSALYAILSSTYGAPGKLPDLRGEFVRGWDDSRGIDSGRVIGTAQAEDYKSHNHSVADPGHAHSFNYQVPLNILDNDRGGGSSIFSIDNSVIPNTAASTTGISVNNSGGAETRPRNIALLACIKY